MDDRSHSDSSWFPRPELICSQALAQSWALDTAFYAQPDALVWEQKLLFSRHWQLCGHLGDLQNQGDHVVTEIAGTPLLLLRDEAANIRALHNVCRHRAGPLAYCNGRGAKALHCKYHGWTYTLQGQLRSAPEMQDADDFDMSRIRLPEASAAVWQQLVFSALHPIVPLHEWLADVDKRLAGRDLSHYRFYRRVSYEVACNWKVYVDNYLEGYHLPHVHPGLNRLLDYRSYKTETGRWHSLQWSPLEGSPLEASVNFYGNGEALYYFLFPNIMLNILPDRLQTNQVIPLGPDRCRVDFDYYYPCANSAATDTDEAPMWSREETERMEQDQTFSDEVQDEDIAICEHVQRNLKSASYACGRLNPKREAGVHHFHELIRAAYRNAAAARNEEI